MELEWIEKFEGSRREELYELYKQEWWTKGRLFDDVMLMIKHSNLAVGCCSPDGKLVGFARVLSDLTFKALIFDVIVHTDFRGRGIGKTLIKYVTNHKTFAKVKTFELYCPDELIPFYNKLGFRKRTSHLLSLER
ncbi:MAG: GNAT family N-acetyltransferase [Rhizobiaceae bacterium]